MAERQSVRALREHLRQMANVEFPEAARRGGYPVRFNHCFLRIVYDNLFGAPWRSVLPQGRPAIEQLDAEQLARATAIGREIIDYPEACRRLNRESLRLRGKLAGG